MEIKHIVCGVGSGNIPKPGDPDNNSRFSATGTWGGVTLKWTLPLTNAHAVAYYQIYKGTDPDPLHSYRLAAINADMYFDAIEENQLNALYYYWLEIVTVNGTVLEKIGPASATPLPTLERYIQLLSHKIDQGFLAQSLNTKIQKITDLEDGIKKQEEYFKNENAAFATALESIQTSLEDVSSLVTEEVKTRAEENQALAEKITTTQTSLGDALASTQVNMQSFINTTEGELQNIGALYTVKVDANGLAGGFGVYNDGKVVDAGFNVDRFWVGRVDDDNDGVTRAKPFIIDDNKVYMDTALIKDLTIDKLKDTTGLFVVKDGKIRAQYIETPRIYATDIDSRNLTIKDQWGNIIFGAGANNNDGTYIRNGTIKQAHISNASIATAHIQDLAVDTLRLRDNAVTETAYMDIGGYRVSGWWGEYRFVSTIWEYTFRGQPSKPLILVTINDAFTRDGDGGSAHNASVLEVRINDSVVYKQYSAEANVNYGMLTGRTTTVIRTNYWGDVNVKVILRSAKAGVYKDTTSWYGNVFFACFKK